MLNRSSNFGCRIFMDINRPSKDVIREFEAFSVANVADALGRFAVMHHAIKPINCPVRKLFGPAVTVRVRPGDNLFIHKALMIAQAGDVLAVDAGGSLTNGLWGEIMTAVALKKSLGGLVIDGAVRDSAYIRESGLAVFARGVIPAGGDKDGPGEVNVSIACGGVAVNPGDIVFGDQDGVVVIPQRDALTVIERTKEVLAKEKEYLNNIKAGDLFPKWIDDNLNKRGCEIIA